MRGKSIVIAAGAAAAVTTLLASAAGAAGLVFNDGFEGGNLAQWTAASGIIVQQQEVYAGSWAARATSNGAGSYAYKSVNPTLSELWYDGRFKVVSQSSSASLVRFRTSTAGAIASMFRRSDGKLAVYNEISGVTTVGTAASTGAWHELEVHLLISGASSQIEVWLDGSKDNTLSKTDSLGTTPVGRVYLGDPASGRTFDIAFDNEMVSSSDFTTGSVPPANTAPPTISGTAQQGQTLTASNGRWSGTTPMNFAYQWRRCASSGANCSDIAGAVGQTHVLGSGDVGLTIRVVVSASNAAGSNSATSAATALVQASQTSTAPCGSVASSTPPATYAHVIWMFFENHSSGQIIGSSAAPYINQLAGQCGLATNFKAITHPSLPNYIAATSGDFWGIADDNPPSSHQLTVPSIYSQVKASGKQWRDYEESSPRNCPQSSSGLYAVKHDPAAYYVGIRSDCANWDVPMGTTTSGNFLSDLQNDRLPAFSFVTPNMCNDMHDCSVTTGDNWLKSWMPIILASPAYQALNTVIVVTWDEDDSKSQNQIATLVISPYTPAGTRSATMFNHYSLLKTTEQLLGISTYLGHAGDAGTTSMRAAFHL